MTEYINLILQLKWTWNKLFKRKFTCVNFLLNLVLLVKIKRDIFKLLKKGKLILPKY